MLRIRYDSKVVVLYIRLRDADIDDSDEVSEGLIMDYDNSRVLMAIEILDDSQALGAAR